MAIAAADVGEVFDWTEKAAQLMVRVIDDMESFRALLLENEPHALNGQSLVGMGRVPADIHAAALLLWECNRDMPDAIFDVQETLEAEFPGAVTQFQCEEFFSDTAVEACRNWVPDLMNETIGVMLWLQNGDNWITKTPPDWGGKRLHIGEFSSYANALFEVRDKLQYITADSLRRLESNVRKERRLLGGWLEKKKKTPKPKSWRQIVQGLGLSPQSTELLIFLCNQDGETEYQYLPANAFEDGVNASDETKHGALKRLQTDMNDSKVYAVIKGRLSIIHKRRAVKIVWDQTPEKK